MPSSSHSHSWLLPTVSSIIFFLKIILELTAEEQKCRADAVVNYGCDSVEKVLTCTETLGVCECKNGKQCAWTRGGNQTVNCPCFKGEESTHDVMASKNLPDPYGYCAAKFAHNKCGYETTCSVHLDTGTCKCNDDKYCVWNYNNIVNCPCTDFAYPTTTAYIAQNSASCIGTFTENKCDQMIHCIEGIGSCVCGDATRTVCAWGPNYSVNCPCGDPVPKTP